LAYFVLGFLAIGAIAYCIYRHRGALGFGGSEGSREATNPDNSAQHPAFISWQTADRTTHDGFKVDMPAGASEIQVPA
jgi:hypothetical protein